MEICFESYFCLLKVRGALKDNSLPAGARNSKKRPNPFYFDEKLTRGAGGG